MTFDGEKLRDTAPPSAEVPRSPLSRTARPRQPSSSRGNGSRAPALADYGRTAGRADDILTPLALIALAYVLYYFLQSLILLKDPPSNDLLLTAANLWNSVAQTVVLDSYRSVLNGMIRQSVLAALIPALAYIILKASARRWPVVGLVFPLVAWLAIAGLFYKLLDNLSPSFADVAPWQYEPPGWQDMLNIQENFNKLLVSLAPWFRSIWSCVTAWLGHFIDLFSLGIVFAYWFHSPGFGAKVALGVVALMNTTAFFFLGVLEAMVSAVPLIGGVGGHIIASLQVCLNFIVMSDIFMLIAVSSLLKKLVDYLFDASWLRRPRPALPAAPQPGEQREAPAREKDPVDREEPLGHVQAE